MAKTLTLYLIQSVSQPLKPTFPVLIWSAPPEPAKPGDEAERYLGTQTGHSLTRPTSGEALIFEIRKDLTKKNPFAMGVTIGSAENNDILLPDPSVSRFHAYLQQDPKTLGWNLVDAESTNGTKIGPLKLVPNQKQALTDGMKLRFGDVETVFMTPDSFVRYLEAMQSS